MTTPDIKTIFLFTKSYPFSSAAEDSFINPELPFLKSSFDAVILIPRSLSGKREKIPAGIDVETTLGQILNPRWGIWYKITSLLYCLTSLIFYEEILTKPKKTLHIRSIKRIIKILGVALRVRKWIVKYIEDDALDLDKTIFYTYWFDEITVGISLAKMKYPAIKLVSRAHGYDLYEERHFPPYLPFRPEIFSKTNKIFAASVNGKQYLASKYPDFATIFCMSHLGVSEQTVLTKSSEDGVFRIVSCSHLIPVKRIELLIEGLAETGKTEENQRFEWTHIGDGQLRSELEQFANTHLPQNVKSTFLGHLPNSSVIAFYQNNPIDVFINVSSSEGTPVSIMEAQSGGIPVIATSVGGNPEIVTPDNGLLLPGNPEPGEIANAICILLNDRNLIRDKKIKSHENWDKNYNSEKNLQVFVTDIMNLLKK